MSDHKLIAALSDISGEKIADAASVYQRKRHTRTRWLRIAALAATIAIVLTAALWPRQEDEGHTITSPGFLKVYAYDLSSGVSIEDQEGYDLAENLVESPSAWFNGMNTYIGLPLAFKLSDEVFENMVVTFDISVEHGSFWGDRSTYKYDDDKDGKHTYDELDLGSTFTIDNGECIFWHDKLIEEEADALGVSLVDYLASMGNLNFMDVIIKANDHIIGYAVIEIRNHKTLYTASVRDVVIYFDENNTLIEVTEEYVREEIANCKTTKAIK